jgi:hypothetical protein
MDNNYIVTLLFLLVTSRANFLSYNDAVWLAILVYMFWVGIVKNRFLKRDIKLFFWFSIFYIVFVFLRNVFFNQLPSEYLISDIIFLFKYIFFAFLFCAILQEKAMEYIVKVIAHLTIISFFFFFLQVIGKGDWVYNFSESLDIPPRPGIPGYTNDIVFTYTKGRHDFRNSGFVWEPGAFGCFLTIALLFQFFINKFTFDKKAYIFIIGIITTLSTTNYLALLILLFLAYRYRVPKLNPGVILLLPVCIVLFATIPILGEKIMGTFNDDMANLDDMKNLSSYYLHHDEQIPLNRFASMTFLYDNLGPKLILGLSNKYDVIINQKYNVNISNGLIEFLAKFGVVGLIYLLYTYAKFCVAYVLKTEHVVYCILILLVLSFGEPILYIPYILVFLFFPYCNIDYQQIWEDRNSTYLIPEFQ